MQNRRNNCLRKQHWKWHATLCQKSAFAKKIHLSEQKNVFKTSLCKSEPKTWKVRRPRRRCADTPTRKINYASSFFASNIETLKYTSGAHKFFTDALCPLFAKRFENFVHWHKKLGKSGKLFFSSFLVLLKPKKWPHSHLALPWMQEWQEDKK